MTRIEKAKIEQASLMAEIGKSAWAEAHGSSAPSEDIRNFLAQKYTENAILSELRKPINQYHLIHYGDRPAGSSNLILNAVDPNIAAQNVAELDRIYLLREFYNLKLGLELLRFNIELAKSTLGMVVNRVYRFGAK